MWVFKNEQLGESGSYKLNFLFNNEKFYIMDNHLAAAWCWQRKILTNQTYNLFHIDKHYDLLDNVSDESIKLFRNQLTSTVFNDYKNIKLEGDSYPLIRFDNYLPIFRRLHPKLIDKYFFATHDDGTYLDEIESYKPEIWDLQDNIEYWLTQKKDHQWILNLDLDYFFVERNEEPYQFLTDDYVLAICREIENAIEKISVITIALSPEFCGGWDSSFRIIDIISTHFHLDFKY